MHVGVVGSTRSRSVDLGHIPLVDISTKSFSAMDLEFAMLALFQNSRSGPPPLVVVERI